jgi:hypothetical protein
VNTIFFRRGPKSVNALMAMIALSRRPFQKFRRKPLQPEASGSVENPAQAVTNYAVRLSPGTYQPRDENTSITDRASALRVLIARHLDLPMQRVDNNLVLSQPEFGQRSLLELAAAIDAQFGVYLAPENFGPEMTVERPIGSVLGEHAKKAS